MTESVTFRMILVFGAMQLVEQFNCFAGPASINVNRNLHEATINFNPLSNSECYFPKEVQFTLNFYGAFQPESYVFDNFSITDTQEVVMQGIDVMNTLSEDELPKFSYLNISSLSHYTLLKVSTLAFETSQMDKCFDEKASRVEMTTSYYFFELLLTDACESEILQAQEYEITIAGIANTRDIDLSTSNANCEYNSDTRIFRCDRNINLVDQMQLPFITCKLVFFITLNGIKHTAEITFENVETGRFNGLFSEIELHIYDDLAHINAKIDPVVYKHFQEATDEQADISVFRLSARNFTTDETFKFEFEYTEFNVKRISIVFKCDTEKCRESLAIMRENIEAFEYQLDVTEFSNGEFSTIASEYVKAAATCISEGYVAMRTKHEFCLRFYADQECTLQKGELAYLQMEFIDSSNGVLEGHTIDAEVIYDGSDRFCTTCEADNCNEIGHVGNGVDMKLLVQEGDTRWLGYFTSIETENYNPTLITVAIISSVIILLCVVDSIQKVILFTRIAKASRRKRG